MKSDGGIAVAQPDRMSIGFLTPSTENTSDPSNEGQKTASPGKTKRSPSEDSSEPPAAIAAPTNRSRDSTPLSDVDEGVLEQASIAMLQRVASDDGLFTSTSASAATSHKPAVASSSSASNFRSPPESPKPNNHFRKRIRNSGTAAGAMPPPPKRQQRGRSRKATLWNSSLSRSQLDGPAAELGLDDTEDDLDVRPTTHQLLGRGGTKTSRAASRALRGPWDDSEDECSSKLRNQDAEKQKYEPLRLYEDSNWVLFDPIKSFPCEFLDPPKFMHDYTYYEPGNERVLEYNLVSNGVRIKSTPKVLKGKTVRYEQDGPKLVS